MRRGVAACALATLALAGCGSDGARTHTAAGASVSIPTKLLRGMRPIGVGPRFELPVTGTPTGGCQTMPGRRLAHIELFGANRVLLIPAGVGHRAGCYGNVVTTDPTGTVHYRAGATLADLFRAWGEPLSATRLACFSGPVRYYLAGRRVRRAPALTEHAEIVIEVGPYVPPHSSYTFPAGL